MGPGRRLLPVAARHSWARGQGGQLPLSATSLPEGLGPGISTRTPSKLSLLRIYRWPLQFLGWTFIWPHSLKALPKIVGVGTGRVRPHGGDCDIRHDLRSNCMPGWHHSKPSSLCHANDDRI